MSDTSTNLARERTRKAADRTLMAWVRTSLSMIGFGFTIAKLGDLAEKTGGYDDPIDGMLVFGASFMVLGVVALVGAIYQYRGVNQAIESGSYEYESRRPLAITVAVILIWVGLFGTVAILV